MTVEEAQKEGYMTISQVAEALDVHPNTVRNRIKKGELQAVKFKSPYGEQVCIHENEIDRVIQTVDVVPVKKEVSAEVVYALLEELQQTRQDVEAFRQLCVELQTQHKKETLELQKQYEHELAVVKQTLVGLRESQTKAIADVTQSFEKGQQEVLHSVNQVVEWSKITLEESKKPWWKRIFG